MNQTADIKALRTGLGISQRELANALGVTQPAVAAVENNGSIPQRATVDRWLSAFNRLLEARGSAQRLTYDEIWSAFCVGRLYPSPKPDLSAGLTALGDLPAVDQSTAAPSAQEA